MIGTKRQIIEFLNKEKDGLFKIQKHRKNRSVSQNKYLHFIFNLISEKTGDDPAEVKEILKSKFLKQYNPTFDTVYVKSTSKLDTKEMKSFIDNIKIFCLEFLDLDIPDPQDERLLKYIDDYFIN